MKDTDRTETSGKSTRYGKKKKEPNIQNRKELRKRRRDIQK
jgi:hypothetical protein